MKKIMTLVVIAMFAVSGAAFAKAKKAHGHKPAPTRNKAAADQTAPAGEEHGHDKAPAHGAQE